MADGSVGQDTFVSKKHASNAKKLYEELVSEIKKDIAYNQTVYAAEDRADALFPERIAGDLISKLMSGRLRYMNPLVVRALNQLELELAVRGEYGYEIAKMGSLDRIYTLIGMQGPNKTPDVRRGCL